jgi:tripartite-type tricarboxylate transporter receptor subunit TctC
VPFAPGGAASVLARLLADEIIRTPGVTTVVENRPGAGTVIGVEAVARAAPDGNTLLLTNTAVLINPHLRKQSYDPLTAFEPICNVANAPVFMAVNSASPYHTLADFVAAARAKPGELTMASLTASGGHIAFEEFKRKANVDITFVPFAGAATSVTALLGGHVTAMLDNIATMSEHINSGKLRALATLSPARVEGLENIPTLAESGYNDYVGWFGLYAPAKVPNATISQLVGWATAAMQAPDAKRKLEPLGLYPTKMCGADFATYVRQQSEEFGRIIREANIKAE